jgi:putative tryptophan/tyrosine transport system substrate-binding protein
MSWSSRRNGSWRNLQGAAQTLGVALQRYEVRSPSDFQAAFATMAQQRPDALVVLEDALTIQHRKEIVDFALKNNLPSSFFAKEAVEAGGLMSYERIGLMRSAAALQPWTRF